MQSLAKKLANPVSDMVSIPFQFNWENGVGPDDGLKNVLNIQPVVPISLSPTLNLIARWILPYVAQPASLGASSGFSDVTFSAFLSPAGGASLTWGIGPVFGLPMTSDSTLGSGRWSAGPTGVVLRIQGPWVYGILANQLWSFAQTSNVDRADVNQTFLQPFVGYCTPGGVTYTLMSESAANWEADDDDTWTVPINFLVSKITKFGPLPFSVQGGAGIYVVAPDGGPEWRVRMNFAVILPRKP
ncbi:MAG TPA: transporter [Candidatus Eisenbacteria bacterium]|nr:transporter [Candidatus Eisenbacteria bacterium]